MSLGASGAGGTGIAGEHNRCSANLNLFALMDAKRSRFCSIRCSRGSAFDVSTLDSRRPTAKS